MAKQELNAAQSEDALPAGGATGEALVKASATDFDTEWGSVASDPDTVMADLVYPDYDDEFEGATLDPKWSFINFTSGYTATVAGGSLALYQPGWTGRFRGVYQTVNMTGDWTVEVNLSNANSSDAAHDAGIGILDSSGKLYIITTGAYGTCIISTFTDINAAGESNKYYTASIGATYLKIEVLSGVITFYTSSNGTTWTSRYSESSTAFLSNFNRLALLTSKPYGTQLITTYTYFRITGGDGTHISVDDEVVLFSGVTGLQIKSGPLLSSLATVTNLSGAAYPANPPFL